ncbi:MAG: peptide chain release factor 2 [Oscillospiraceae bacterium]|nr:peptide chain release factor 2 [Oscillospiraceae bacterium]
MLLLDEYKQKLAELRPAIHDLGEALGLSHLRLRKEELEQRSAQPDFWNDADAARVVLAELGGIKQKIEDYETMCTDAEDVETFIEMAEEEDDEDMVPEIQEQLALLDAKVEKMQLATLLTGEYDRSNAILTFHAGAGGTEAQDWVSMLYRMYTRFCADQGFTVQVLDMLDGDEAGIKSASILVSGENAYGYLKSENGVHRLVRVSPFDASGRRQTSFASLEVMPEIDDNIEVDIRPEDIEMQVFRSSGAGGQHINKTSSAVRLIHKPTGIVVSCQTERSQFQNRDTAMKMLKSKLMQIKTQEHLDKIEDIKGVQNLIAWGSQIRSYVFMPYTLVKDHRTNFENGNVNAVMDGDLEGFVNAYLKALSRGELKD